MKQGVYKFSVTYRRMGTIESVWVEYDTVVAAAIGCKAVFGDALGKHSNIEQVLVADDIKLLTDNSMFVDLFKEYIGRTGHDPISAIVDNNEGDDGFWTAYDAAYKGHALPDERTES